MSESNIGWATLAVIPGMTGFGAALSKGLAPQMAAAGASAGSGLAKGMLVGIGAATAAVVAIGVASTKMAGDYQQATTLLVTGAGESEDAIGKVRDGLLKMAPAVGIGPTALAKAMFMVESAGFHGAAGLTVMAAAAQGAKVGGAEATTVANGLTTALTDYNLPASEAAHVTSKLIATVAAGKTTMEQLSGSLSTVLPFASSLGVSLDDLAGAMATMTGEGISADQSATMLKFTMMSMANETPKGLKALASIGMTAQQLKDNLSSKGVGGALQAVTEQIGKKFPAGSVEATKALAAIVGGTRGMGSALALTGTHAETLTANIASIKGAVTEADGSVRGWALTQEDMNTQIDRGKALASSLAIEFGTHLLPAVTKVFKGVIDFVTSMKDGTGAGGTFRDVLTTIYDRGIKPIGEFLTATAIPAIQNFIKGFQDGTGAGGGFRDLLTEIYNDAIKPIGDFLTKTAVPALQSFATEFTNGTGTGGAFRDTLVDLRDNVLKPIGSWITDTGLPALKSIETWITDDGIPALSEFKDWIVDNKDTLKILGEFITIVLLPIFADMAAKAVASAFTQVGAWVSTQAAGITSSASQLASHYVVVGGWIMSTAQATKSAGETVAIWAMLRADAITSSSVVAGAMAGMSVSAGTAIASMLGSFGLLAGGILFLNTQWDNAGNAWAIVWRGARDGATTSATWIRLQWETFGNWLKGLFWADALTQWSNGITTKCNEVVAAFKAVPDTVRSLFKDPLTWLRQNGADVMQGFLNGLTGGVWGETQSFIGGIAGWIKDHKGPLSLDKELLKPAGHAMMLGLNDSLSAGFGQVQANVDGMNGQIAGSMGGSQASMLAFLRQVQAMGFSVAENPWFGGVSAGHASTAQGGMHYLGRAADINAGAGTSAAEQAKLGSILGLAHSYGLSTKFMVPGHYNHLHVQYDKGGYLQPGGLGVNNLRSPERVLTPSNTRSFDQLIEMLASGKFPGTNSLEGSAVTVRVGEQEFAGYIESIADARVSAGISSEAAAVRARPRR